MNIVHAIKKLFGAEVSPPPPMVTHHVPAVYNLGEPLVPAVPPVPKKARSYRERDSLTREEAETFCKSRCPDCGAGLLAGPEGGCCQNVLCESDSCGSKFNYMGPFGIERLNDASPKKTLERKSAYRS